MDEQPDVLRSDLSNFDPCHEQEIVHLTTTYPDVCGPIRRRSEQSAMTQRVGPRDSR